MTTVVISQPMYFPWPGFLAQLSLADVVIWLVDAQYSRGFTNRVQIRTLNGHAWLTVPLEKGGGRQSILDLKPAKPDWLDDHITRLGQSLGGAPYKEIAIGCLEKLRPMDNLCASLVSSSEILADATEVPLKQRYSSTDLGVSASGSARILELTRAVGGRRYITGHGARNYLDHPAFENQGIEVHYMDYDVRPWTAEDTQFTPFVSGLDLLAHVGPSAAKGYLNPKTLHWRKFLEQGHQG